MIMFKQVPGIKSLAYIINGSLGYRALMCICSYLLVMKKGLKNYLCVWRTGYDKVHPWLPLGINTA